MARASGPPPPNSRAALLRLAALLLLGLLLVWSYRVTEVDLGRLARDADKVLGSVDADGNPKDGILIRLLRPSLLTRGQITQEVVVPLEVPCTSGIGPEQAPAATGPEVLLSSYCLGAGDSVTVSGTGLRPDTSGRLYWRPLGREGRVPGPRLTTDASGAFTLDTTVRPILAEIGGESSIQILLTWESDTIAPSAALQTTIAKIIETIFLALMATTLGAMIAMPISFLAARNLMPRTALGNATYNVTRGFLNLVRSVEPLILATVFAIWVGFGPFAGVLALAVSTVANIGKLYAEAAESIDAGPLEAIRSTGASEMQTIRFAVIPQVVPPYLSFTIYYWDINVRMATIIGFVGGGGIGRALNTWIGLTSWNEAATAIWAIVLVVMTMDYVSAIVRERLI